MRSFLAFLTLLSLAFSFASCSRYAPGQAGEAHEIAAPTPVPTLEPLDEKRDAELERQIAEIAQTAQGEVGVGAVLLETGQSAWLNRDGHFASQSVYKLPIAMAVLRMVDEGKTALDRDIVVRPDDYVRRGFHSPIRNLNPQGTVMPLYEIVRYSLSESDGTASDVLLDLAGGPEAVQQYLAGIGITDFIVADSEKSISKDWETQFRNWATPAASVHLLRAIQQRRAGLSEAMTGVLLDFMTATTTGHRRLKRGIPQGSTLAHKTGTGGTEAESLARTGRSAEITANTNASADSNLAAPAPKTRRTARPTPTPKPSPADRNSGPEPGPVVSATNDIGIITLPDGRHILIAVYIQNSTADTWTRERAIADIAKAVCDRWFAAPTSETPQTPTPSVRGTRQYQ